MEQFLEFFVRTFERDRDAHAVQTIDTSYTSTARFEVVTDTTGLTLVQRPWPVSRRMKFPVDLASPPWKHAWVAEIDHRLVGFIATQFEDWNRRLAIWHFYVDHSVRRRGIGKSLMETAVAHGRKLGAVTVWTETSNCNVEGVEIYRSLGFELCGCDTPLYKGTASHDEFAIYMAHSLEPE